jgi:hypothetical protein
MRYPIFVVEGRTVHCFPTIKYAQAWLEPEDVDNGEYVAYDGNGSKLHLYTKWVTKTVRFLWLSREAERNIVVLEEMEPTVDAAHELRKYLVDDLLWHGFSPDLLETMSLEKLVQNVTEINC